MNHSVLKTLSPLDIRISRVVTAEMLRHPISPLLSTAVSALLEELTRVKYADIPPIFVTEGSANEVHRQVAECIKAWVESRPRMRMLRSTANIDEQPEEERQRAKKVRRR